MSAATAISEDGDPIMIVGGGLAGGNAVVSLREQGFRGEVVLVGREPGVPFGRPPLSKTYLRSEEPLNDWYVEAPHWYDDHSVTRIHENVAQVDPASRIVRLDSERELVYQKLLLATGGRNRRLKLPGGDLAGVHQLRSVAESDAIKAEAVEGRRAVVVGMSFIGSEVAASLTQLGVHVTAMFSGQVPLERVLGPQFGAVFAAVHSEKGVELLADDPLVALEGDGRVEAAVSRSGRRVDCDFVVAGIGIEPAWPLFVEQAPADSNGLLVDAACRTSLPDVFAAGDVANHRHPVFGRVRVEHYNNGEKMGQAAARSILGDDAPYDYIHTFWSDQYDHKLEYAGHAEKWDQFVVRGSVDDREFLGFYLQEGQIRAAAGFDRGGDPELEADSEMAACARLVGARAHPAADQLADESVDLWSLVP